MKTDPAETRRDGAQAFGGYVRRYLRRGKAHREPGSADRAYGPAPAS